ncbi:hypothetical protein JAAARDRAFT_211597 [Jaapia argillacea MUCL 33604]|uniref:Uncharacterized protein n=1 Tax=Jaapia argillacea MUCL 33604 TaxID=933084 RepID=A0A067PI22_9AGAM|nr:hypothetical protein JAAARDRAFT_211597 [Jaapia argillacea MUCL 33604]
MKLIQSLLALLSTAYLVSSAGVPVVTEYATLYSACEAGGSNVYVAVQYANTPKIALYSYDECYPYEVNGNLAEMAVFCKSVTCENNPNPDCTGGAVPPVPVPIPAGLTLVNAADFVQLLGQGATCQENKLPL